MENEVQCEYGRRHSCSLMGKSCNLTYSSCMSVDIRKPKTVWEISHHITPSSKIWVHGNRFYICRPNDGTDLDRYSTIERLKLQNTIEKAIGKARVFLDENIEGVFE